MQAYENGDTVKIFEPFVQLSLIFIDTGFTHAPRSENTNGVASSYCILVLTTPFTFVFIHICVLWGKMFISYPVDLVKFCLLTQFAVFVPLQSLIMFYKCSFILLLICGSIHKLINVSLGPFWDFVAFKIFLTGRSH